MAHSGDYSIPTLGDWFLAAGLTVFEVRRLLACSRDQAEAVWFWPPSGEAGDLDVLALAYGVHRGRLGELVERAVGQMGR